MKKLRHAFSKENFEKKYWHDIVASRGWPMEPYYVHLHELLVANNFYKDRNEVTDNKEATDEED